MRVRVPPLVRLRVNLTRAHRNGNAQERAPAGANDEQKRAAKNAKLTVSRKATRASPARVRVRVTVRLRARIRDEQKRDTQEKLAGAVAITKSRKPAKANPAKPAKVKGRTKAK